MKVKDNISSQKLQTKIDSSYASTDVDPVTDRRSVGGQALISCPLQIVSSGVDTIDITAKVKLSEKLIDGLHEAKQRLQTTEGSQVHFQFGISKCFSFNLQRTGNKLFPYILKTGDITVGISKRSSDSKIPNVSVHIGSLSSNSGVLEVLRKIKMWFRYHGCFSLGEQVSRIDLYCDVERDIGLFNLSSQEYQKTRARHYAVYYRHRKVCGAQAGKGSIVCRIYDKLAEMTDKQAHNKRAIFEEIWGGQKAAVTRVEFQLRREAIKELCKGKTDARTVCAQIRKIWAYLTNDWMFLSGKVVDRKHNNHQRATRSRVWFWVQRAFGKAQQPVNRSKGYTTHNAKALIAQVNGIMLTLMAGAEIQSDDIFEMLNRATNIIKKGLADSLSKPGFEKDYLSRMVKANLSF